MSELNPYVVLGVTPLSTKAQIYKAYEKAVGLNKGADRGYTRDEILAAATLLADDTERSKYNLKYLDTRAALIAEAIRIAIDQKMEDEEKGLGSGILRLTPYAGSFNPHGLQEPEVAAIYQKVKDMMGKKDDKWQVNEIGLIDRHVVKTAMFEVMLQIASEQHEIIDKLHDAKMASDTQAGAFADASKIMCARFTEGDAFAQFCAQETSQGHGLTSEVHAATILHVLIIDPEEDHGQRLALLAKKPIADKLLADDFHYNPVFFKLVDLGVYSRDDIMDLSTRNASLKIGKGLGANEQDRTLQHALTIIERNEAKRRGSRAGARPGGYEA